MSLNGTASSGWLLRTGGCVTAIVLLLYFVGLWLGRAFAPMKSVGNSVTCQKNLMVLVRAEKMYAMDYEDRLPPADGWMDRIDFFLDNKDKGRLTCPEVGPPRGPRYGYAMNGELSGKVQAKVEGLDRKPLLFDSPDLTRSAVSQGVTLPKPGRHIGQRSKGQSLKRGNYEGLAGGGVRFLPDNAATVSGSSRD
jgi:hypothetical protein